MSNVTSVVSSVVVVMVRRKEKRFVMYVRTFLNDLKWKRNQNKTQSTFKQNFLPDLIRFRSLL